MSEEKNDDTIIVDIEKYNEKVNYDKVNEDTFWLTTKYKVTVTDGNKKNSYIIVDKTDYNNYMHNYPNTDSLFHGINKAFDKKYTITEYNNDRQEKTSKQQTFMFHYNPNSIDATGANSNVNTEQKNNILNVLDKSGFCKLKGRKININDKTKEEEQKLNNFQIYEDKRYSIYSTNNFLNSVALKAKQIGRWFSDAWASLKWRFVEWNAAAKTNLNDINTGKNKNINK